MEMRTFYWTMAIMAGISLIGGIMQGQQAEKEAEAQAAYLDIEAGQERKQHGRDIADLDREEKRVMARQRALMAAGGGISEGSDLEVLSGTAEAFGRKGHRLSDDSSVRTSLLNLKASNTRSAGQSAKTAAIFGGAAKAAGTLYSMPGAK